MESLNQRRLNRQLDECLGMLAEAKSEHLVIRDLLAGTKSNYYAKFEELRRSCVPLTYDHLRVIRARMISAGQIVEKLKNTETMSESEAEAEALERIMKDTKLTDDIFEMEAQIRKQGMRRIWIDFLNEDIQLKKEHQSVDLVVILHKLKQIIVKLHPEGRIGKNYNAKEIQVLDRYWSELNQRGWATLDKNVVAHINESGLDLLIRCFNEEMKLARMTDDRLSDSELTLEQTEELLELSLNRTNREFLDIRKQINEYISEINYLNSALKLENFSEHIDDTEKLNQSLMDEIRNITDRIGMKPDRFDFEKKFIALNIVF